MHCSGLESWEGDETAFLLLCYFCWQASPWRWGLPAAAATVFSVWDGGGSLAPIPVELWGRIHDISSSRSLFILPPPPIVAEVGAPTGPSFLGLHYKVLLFQSI